MYEIPCKDWDKRYIGETGRTLKKRITEHKLEVKRGDTSNGIAVHAWEAQHHVDWESAKVRDTESNLWKGKLLEAIHIPTLENSR